ncbi:MAG: signal peptidase I [Chthonomonas sp.]|nr:signal peptidase I [Chthonomonas sp.]
MEFLAPFLAQSQTSPTVNFIDSIARTKISVIVIVCLVATILRLAINPVLHRAPAHLRQSGNLRALRFATELLDAIVYAGIFVFMVIRPFILQTFVIPSGSMVPTLMVSDMIIANKWVYRFNEPERGDIVIFRPPALAIEQGPPGTAPDTSYIKRLLGVPGDVVEMDDNRLKLNGKFVEDKAMHFSLALNERTFNPIEPTDVSANAVMDFKMVEQGGKLLAVQRYNSQGPTYLLVMGKMVTDPVEVDEIWKKPAAKIPDGKFLMVGDNRNNSGDGRFWGLVDRDDIIGRSEVIFFPVGRMSRTKSVTLGK